MSFTVLAVKHLSRFAIHYVWVKNALSSELGQLFRQRKECAQVVSAWDSVIGQHSGDKGLYNPVRSKLGK